MRILKPLVLRNGFTWLPVHYTHDVEEGKNLPEWESNARSAYPRPIDFDREMSIDFGLSVGALAYPRFSDAKHLGKTLYDPTRPLRVCFDFNTNPMSLVVAQQHDQVKQIHALWESVHGPTTIDQTVLEFRQRFTEHRADVILYGDATKGTNAQTAQSNWDVVRFAFRGYHIVPEMRLPLANPNVGNRLNSVNRLLGGLGPYTIVVDETWCPELAMDFREVILTKDGKQIYKEKDPDKPMYFRTHASDAFGYYLFFEHPTVMEVITHLDKKRDPIVPGRLLGEVEWGTAVEKQQRAAGEKRRPIDKTRAR